ncbi:MAG: hypothetical protein HZY78_04245 [Burkholderiaceae bacterium]|nr:MAG: hypothetical protein HZY78_04245 [Burkholderiaceae bacterium]
MTPAAGLRERPGGDREMPPAGGFLFFSGPDNFRLARRVGSRSLRPHCFTKEDNCAAKRLVRRDILFVQPIDPAR